MSDARIEVLRAAYLAGKVSGDFPRSLLRQFDERGGLSAKQWDWVVRLVQPKPAVDVGNFAGVIALFAKAATHLKYPKINLQLADGAPLRLSVAGPRSKAPGSVNLTDGRGFSTGIFYGRVSPAGAANFSGRADDRAAEIAGVLKRLAAEPAKVAAEYGRLTGNCCFCHKALSDERSTAVGYGATCAEHYGLPWGAAARSEEAA